MSIWTNIFRILLAALASAIAAYAFNFQYYYAATLWPPLSAALVALLLLELGIIAGCILLRRNVWIILAGMLACNVGASLVRLLGDSSKSFDASWAIMNVFHVTLVIGVTLALAMATGATSKSDSAMR